MDAIYLLEINTETISAIIKIKSPFILGCTYGEGIKYSKYAAYTQPPQTWYICK